MLKSMTVEISLEIKKAPRPEDDGLFIIGIYINDHLIISLWCDQITKWSEESYTFSMKGKCICGIGAKKVKIAEELKEFTFKPKL